MSSLTTAENLHGIGLRIAMTMIIFSLSLWKTRHFLWKSTPICGKLGVYWMNFWFKANLIGLVIRWLNMN